MSVEAVKNTVNPSSGIMAEEHKKSKDGNMVLPFSRSNSKVVDAEQNPTDMKETKDSKKEEEGKSGSVPFYKLFSFADSIDVVLMILGTVGAVANGSALPLTTLLFGNLINSFGGNKNDHSVLHQVSKVIIAQTVC